VSLALKVARNLIIPLFLGVVGAAVAESIPVDWQHLVVGGFIGFAYGLGVFLRD